MSVESGPPPINPSLVNYIVAAALEQAIASSIPVSTVQISIIAPPPAAAPMGEQYQVANVGLAMAALAAAEDNTFSTLLIPILVPVAESAQKAGPNVAPHRNSAPSFTAAPTTRLQNAPSATFQRHTAIPAFSHFSKEEKAQLINKVLSTSLLLEPQPGKRAGEPPLSAFKALVLSQQALLLSKEAMHLEQLIKEGDKTPSKQMEKLLTQLSTLHKNLQDIESQLTGKKNQEPLPANPKQAAELLKETGERLSSQARERFNEKLETIAERLQSISKGEKEGISPTKSTSTEVHSISNRSETAAESSKAALKAAEVISIQTPEALHALGEKMHRKEMSFPTLVNLPYPMGKAKESHVAKGGEKEKAGEEKRGKQPWGTLSKTSIQKMVLVPEGKLLFHGKILMLPAFLIGAVPVTNEQFADWLSEAHALKKIKLTPNGHVLSKHGQLICKLQSAASTSQLQTTAQHDTFSYSPLPGMGKHPVVQVSRLGAELYCKDNAFRLPSVAEWEKASGMQIEEEGIPLKKFLYGCGSDTIDLTAANYREGIRPFTDNRTRPVGFYNGETAFAEKGKSYVTQNSPSPYGCYDMSGNVWEWVDGNTAKGGSYNTPPENLAIEAHLEVDDPLLCLSDVGFRVAMDIH